MGGIGVRPGRKGERENGLGFVPDLHEVGCGRKERIVAVVIYRAGEYASVRQGVWEEM
jgi:hypothetical protein